MVNSPRRIRALDVWMNGEPVGTWHPSRAGVPQFTYDAQWLRSPRCRALSLSLPLLPGNEPHRGDRVTWLFDNLLPDSRLIRERVRARFRLDSLDPFDLLAAIGRDCVGAVQLVPAGSAPRDVRQIHAQQLAEHEVAQLLRQVTMTERFGDHAHDDEFRISIAGAQEKTALLRHEGHWCRPLGATPTTHLLKLPLGLVGNMRADLGTSVENEWLCLQLLHELGLPVPHSEMATFRDQAGAVKVLVVERFDRQQTRDVTHGAPWIVRLPQEDLCQATGTPPTRKYESDGGPTLYDCLDVLRAGNAPDDDMLEFVKAQLAFWLLAAPDGHAKNFSIFLHRHGHTMTPLYDVLSAWPIIGTGANEWAYQDVKLAMALRGSRPYRHLNRIAVRHWRALAARTGRTDAFTSLQLMVVATDAALTRLEQRLPADFPPVVWARIAAGVRAQVQRFNMGLTAGEA
jgi:serine/threonine-protein kinase HipA